MDLDSSAIVFLLRGGRRPAAAGVSLGFACARPQVVRSRSTGVVSMDVTSRRMYLRAHSLSASTLCAPLLGLRFLVSYRTLASRATRDGLHTLRTSASRAASSGASSPLTALRRTAKRKNSKPCLKQHNRRRPRTRCRRAARAPMTTQTLVLQGESELRLEVDFDKIVVVAVKEGIAEVLGLELAQGKCSFCWCRSPSTPGSARAWKSWARRRAATLPEGAKHAAYVKCPFALTWRPATRRARRARSRNRSRARPTRPARRVWALRRARRPCRPTSTSALSGVCAEYSKACAPTSECRGPRVLVCGPTDSGKSTALRDAVRICSQIRPRAGLRRPGPGSRRLRRRRPAPSRRVVLIEIGPRYKRVLWVVWMMPRWLFGSARRNRRRTRLYDHVVEQLAKACAERLHADRTLDVSGLIINSWVGRRRRVPVVAADRVRFFGRLCFSWRTIGCSRICGRRCRGPWPWPSSHGPAASCSASRRIDDARATRRSTSIFMAHRVT